MPALTKYWKKGGIYFENHVAVVPVCGPSRSSLKLGRYPHNNGYKMNGDISSVASYCGKAGHANDTVGNWLARAGIHTAFLGKNINNCESPPESGWSHFGGLQNTYDFYNASIYDVDFFDGDGTMPSRDGGIKLMTHVHQSQFLADFTVKQAHIAKNRSKPFFIHTTPVMPHWGTCIGPQPPAPGYGPDDPHWEFTLVNPVTGRVTPRPISPCPSHAHAHDFDGQTNPHIHSWNVTASGVIPYFMSNLAVDSWDVVREDLGWRNRSAAVVDLDDLIAHVFAGLEELDLLDNTFAFFSSDNGYHLGEHKLVFGKGQPYEPSVRLPMYVRGPGVPAGVVSKLPTTHLDITVTIVALMGASHAPATPRDLDGLSFAAALADTPAASQLRATPEAWRDFSFSEFFMNDCTWWNVRTVNSTHKFSFHYWCTGEAEVFDLLKDPLQLTNLAPGGEASPGTELGRLAVAEMLPKAIALSSCSHAGCWTPEPKPVPALAPNMTHLPCYTVRKLAKHPMWPIGNLGKVGATHRFQGWACIPYASKVNETVVVHIKVDNVLDKVIDANISRPDLKGGPCMGGNLHHGFTGSVPASAMEGKHTLTAFAVNTAPNAKREPMVLLGEDKLCDGVSCHSALAKLDLSGVSAWSAAQVMMAVL